VRNLRRILRNCIAMVQHREGCCAHRNVPFGCMKAGEFLYYVLPFEARMCYMKFDVLVRKFSVSVYLLVELTACGFLTVSYSLFLPKISGYWSVCLYKWQWFKKLSTFLGILRLCLKCTSLRDLGFSRQWLWTLAIFFDVTQCILVEFYQCFTLFTPCIFVILN
jgi:hypothetical protein